MEALKSHTHTSATVLITGLIIVFSNGCTNNPTTFSGIRDEIVAGPSVTDADGNVYTSIVIGTQTWTVENLRTTKYNDGTPLPHITDTMQWSNLTTPGYCFYGNDTDAAEQEKLGALYNWYAINTGKLPPAGWHVPTDAEWATLEHYLIANGYNWDKSIKGNKIAKSLAATTGWNSIGIKGMIGHDIEKNNSTGFSALPGGHRDFTGNFQFKSDEGYWWSATENGESYAYYRYLNCTFVSINRYDLSKKFGYSVRLVLNN